MKTMFETKSKRMCSFFLTHGLLDLIKPVYTVKIFFVTHMFGARTFAIINCLTAKKISRTSLCVLGNLVSLNMNLRVIFYSQCNLNRINP